MILAKCMWSYSSIYIPHTSRMTRLCTLQKKCPTCIKYTHIQPQNFPSEMHWRNVRSLQLQGILILGCPQVQTFDPPECDVCNRGRRTSYGLQGVTRRKDTSSGFASISAHVPPQPGACINPWQRAAPINVHDTNAADQVVAAILENEDAEQIADFCPRRHKPATKKLPQLSSMVTPSSDEVNQLTAQLKALTQQLKAVERDNALQRAHTKMMGDARVLERSRRRGF
jgi:hypothetical protein